MTVGRPRTVISFIARAAADEPIVFNATVRSPRLHLGHDAHGEIAVAAHGGNGSIQPGEGTHERTDEAGQPRRARMAPEVRHPQPAREEEDAGLGRDAEPDPFEQTQELTRGEGLLEAIGVETRAVQQVDEQGSENGSSLFGTPIMAMPPGLSTRASSRAAVSYSGECSIVPIE